jgi:hypothetical protein
MSMEKSGSVVLTEDDLKQYNDGIVSKRVQETWDLSMDELRSVVEKGQFEKNGKLNEQIKDSE